MPVAILAKFREWYILAIAACLIVAGLYLASVSSMPTGPAESSSQAPQSQTAAKRPAPPSAPTAAAQPPERAPPPAPVAAAPGRPAVPSAPTAHEMPGHPSTPAQPAGSPASVLTAANAPPAQPVAQALPTPAAAATVDGDATTGRQVFRKCQACHSLEPGKNALGPSLAGIVGKKSGEVPNYIIRLR